MRALGRARRSSLGRAPPWRWGAAGEALLCVAAVTPDTGHDVLLDGLATATDLAWRCSCVGSLDRDAAFARGAWRRSRESALRGRVRFHGPHVGSDLDRAYAAAD